MLLLAGIHGACAYYGVHELLDFGLAELGALLGQPSPQLVHGDGAAVVGVHALEHLLQTSDLFLRQAPGNDLPVRDLIWLEILHPKTNVSDFFFLQGMAENEYTLSAAFLNWFIALNCLSLFMTALSSGVSGASPSSLIQG